MIKIIWLFLLLFFTTSAQSKMAFLPAPLSVMASSNLVESIKITWKENAKGGAIDFYKIYRSTTTDVTGKEELGTIKKGTPLVFTDLNLIPLKKYYYWVVSCPPQNAGFIDSNVDASVNCSNIFVQKAVVGQAKNRKMPVPSNFKVSNNAEGFVLLQWDSVSNASSYRVRRDGKSYEMVTTNSFIDKNVVAKKSYTYDVSACDQFKNCGAIVKKGIKATGNVVVVPSITSINAAPQSITQGQSLTLSAMLNGVLPTGYNVKVDYGNGLTSMSGSGTNFSLTEIPTSIGSIIYSVGIYNNENILKSNQLKGNFLVNAVLPTVNFISGDSETLVNTDYKVQFLVQGADLIEVDWGDETINPQPTYNNTTLSFSHNYTVAGTYKIRATVQNSSGSTGQVSVFKTVLVRDGKVDLKSPYTKIANDGSELPDNAILGANPKDWACTKDNKTGLIWEIKTSDGGLRDKDSSYTWYELDSSKNGGFVGYANGNGLGTCKGNECDTYAYKNAVNAQGLCGSNDWKLPTRDELLSLIYCSDDKFTIPDASYTGLICTGTPALPTIQMSYFPDTFSWYWSSSIQQQEGAWAVNFTYNSGSETNPGVYSYGKHGYMAIRLVRSTKTTGYTKIANDGSQLSDDAKLGTNPTDWACTKDNKTGLIWEVKTTDGGLRDMNNHYSWYEPDASKNGGFEGYKNNSSSSYGDTNICKGSECDTYAFTKAVNAQGLCGAKDWRLPNNEELQGLVYCSDEKYANLGKDEWGYICSSNSNNNLTTQSPTINTTYFPNHRVSSWFWSSSPYANFSNYAWSVYFGNGYSYNDYKSSEYNVRLVRG